MYSKDSNGNVFEIGGTGGAIINQTYDMGDYNRDVYFDAGDANDGIFAVQGSYDGGGA